MPQTWSELFACSVEACKEHSAVEMRCTKCEHHFCLTHRHHDSCYGNHEDVLPWRLPKMQFAKAKEESDKKVCLCGDTINGNMCIGFYFHCIAFVRTNVISLFSIQCLFCFILIYETLNVHCFLYLVKVYWVSHKEILNLCNFLCLLGLMQK